MEQLLFWKEYCVILFVLYIKCWNILFVDKILIEDEKVVKIYIIIK